MHEPHKTNNSLSEIILGGQDGLVSILGLVLGLSAATKSTHIVIAGGLATIIAETVSMGAVAYTSRMAAKEYYFAERRQEDREVDEIPAAEKKEIETLYAAKGFSGRLLQDIVKHITSDRQLWIDTMMREELNLEPVISRDVYKYSLIVGISTFVGGFVPLIPYFFLEVHPALVGSLIISGIALIFVGAYKAKITLGNQLKSAIQMLLIGMGAAIIGYLVGLLFKV